MPDEPTSGAKIDTIIRGLADWRADKLSQLRKVILSSDVDVIETVKWQKPSNPAGVPVWECAGIICTGETYKDKVKLTFAKGASLPDPTGLFNSSLEGNARRAIDVFEGDEVDADVLKALIQAAIRLNRAGKAK